MERSSGDWKAWYGTPDAPAPPEQVHANVPSSLMVGVSPVHSANAVDVAYRTNNGPELSLGSTLTRTDYSRNQQFFRVDFPQFTQGSHVEYAPIIRKAGRRMEFGHRERFPSSFQVVAPPQVATAPKSGADMTFYPYRMEHLARITANFETYPVYIGETPDGLFVDFPVGEGLCEGKIQGHVSRKTSDLMRFRTDGIGIQDIRMIITTSGGGNILVLGSGFTDFGPNAYEKIKKGEVPLEAPVVEAVHFLAADPNYRWLDRLQCLSIGYATPKVVCYDMYGIQSLAASPKWER